MFSVAAHRNKTTVHLSETCRLCLCTKTMFLPVCNSTESLQDTFAQFQNFTQFLQQSRLLFR